MEKIKASYEEWIEKVIPWLLSHGIKIVIFVVVALILNKIIYKFIERAVRVAVVGSYFTSKEAEEKRENTLIKIFSATMKICLFTITTLMVLQEFGIEIGPILAAAGIVGLAFGFGGQYLIRDIISGLFIILENQYRIGDVVSFDSASGLVEDISLRKTTLRDLDGTVHHVPHGEIKKVSNLSKDFARVNLNVGVSYNSELDQVIEVINKTANEMAEDPAWKEFILKTPQFLRVDEFADSSIIVKIVGDVMALKQWDVTGELRKRLKKAFDETGIEIPFPQVVVNQPALKEKTQMKEKEEKKM